MNASSGIPVSQAAAQAIHGELAEQVKHDDDDECVRRIAMQAAHDARGVPLFVRHVFDGCVSVDDAGVEEDVQVNARCRRDPVEVPAESPEPGERVVALAERVFEYALSLAEEPVQPALYESHGSVIARCAIH
jgi:hypothetical protein